MKNNSSVTPRELILSLIKADLQSNRLILLLNKVGLLVEEYGLSLDTMILKLMEFEDKECDDELYKLYIFTLDRICQEEEDSAEFRKHLDNYAIELYTELLTEKKLRERLLSQNAE